MMTVIVRNKKTFRGTGFYIGRPSPLGNPYSHLKNSLAEFAAESRDDSVLKYKPYFYKMLESDENFRAIIENMVRRAIYGDDINLICFCSPKACHGDVIKEYIDERVKESNLE